MNEALNEVASKQGLSFGQQLRRERESRQWTQAQLSIEAVGDESLVVSIRRWENGYAHPRPGIKARLSEVFGKPPERWGTGILTYWHVPFLSNPYFTGRDATLQHLHRLLAAANTQLASRVCAISGLGGMGKTQTALEYAHRYSSEYEAVLWVQASSRDILIADFARLAQILHVLKNEETDQTRVITAMTVWLKEHTPWLLIFDNADDLKLVSEFLPRQPHGASLLTTRSSITASRITTIALEQMSQEEGTTFLLRRISPETVEKQDGKREKRVEKSKLDAASELWKMMGGLPLALDQAGAYINAAQSSLNEYVSLYRRHRKALLEDRGETAPEHPDAVATTWSLSFQQVEQQNLAAAQLLQLCAFLSSDAIPEAILSKGAEHLPLPLQEIVTSDLLMHKAIKTLSAYSLMRRNAEDKTLSVHQLVQAVLQDTLDTDAQRLWAERAMLAVNAAFPEPPFADWLQCERLLPHVLTCFSWIEQEQRPSLEASALFDNVGSFLREQGQYAEAKQLLEAAISIREHYPEAEDLLATSLSNLAGLYSYQGKLAEAEQLVERAHAIRERILGNDHPDTATSLSHLGLLAMQQGKLAQAEPLLLQALNLYQRSLGADHPAVARTMGNLAVLYEDQGRYTEAEEFNEQALAVYEHTLEPTHPAIARSLSNLGLISLMSGKYEKAKALLERALSIQESEPLDAAYSLSGLAEIAREQGEYEQAATYYTRVRAIREQYLEADHPDRANALEGLADVYREQQRYVEAEQLYQQALLIWEQQFGTESLQTTRSLTGLAHLAREQKNDTEAEFLYQRALHIHEQGANPQHPKTAETLEGLAQLREAQGDRDEAKSLYMRTLTIREQTLGATHPKTIKTRTKLKDLL